MRNKLMLAALLAATAASSPATQPTPEERGGIQTETQRRLAQGDAKVPWHLIGLFGLFGLLGLRRRHPDDSYHPAPLE